MKKPIAFAFVLGLALFLAGCGHSSVVEKNNERFSNAVKSVTAEEVGLHDLADFEWDVMFTFAPYTPKESMEEVIGFQSDDIRETVNEGMTQLLFIKGEKVVCSIHGYSSNLGYGISFGTRYHDGHFLSVRHDESVLFSVDRSGGEISLLYEKADAMWDRRPMIMVDGKIYLDTGKQMPVEIAQSEILEASRHRSAERKSRPKTEKVTLAARAPNMPTGTTGLLSCCKMNGLFLSRKQNS